MTLGTTIWIVIFAVSALVFFGIAAIISVYGTKDLRNLLRESKKRE
ncbi:MAG: hypothetical protein HY961_06075 [Ignavibacteriae bacterium]|nr:hypothetical protein [Ignavibacteriota bacterium]